MRQDTKDPLELECIEFVTKRAADAAQFALNDLKYAIMGCVE